MAAEYPLDHNLDRISFSACLALAVHAVILFAVGFVMQPPPPAQQSLEVTLAQYRSDQAPEKADYLAPVNQRGSGTLDKKAQLTTTRLTPITAAHPAPVERHMQNRPALTADARIIHTTQSPEQVPDTKSRRAVEPHTTKTPRHDRQEQRRKEIASLEAKLDREQQAYAHRPRIHRITSVTAKASADARYQFKWQQKVELMGNRHYPQAARRRKLEGDVRLMVALLPDGSIKAIEVLASSGSPILDQAAIRSVRLAAPFEPFPPAIRRKADILEIIRTWEFRAGRLTSHG